VTCAEFQELVALLAAGALDPAERAAAEAHLAEPAHQGCFEALKNAAVTWDAVGRSLSPARLDERVWRGIAAEIGRRPRISAVRTWAGWAAAAALALALAGVQGARIRAEKRAGALATADRERAECARDLEEARGEATLQREALALLASPATQVISLAPQAGAGMTARALVNLPARAGVLYAAGPPAPQGKDYELWVIRGDRKLPAGLLRARAGGAILTRIDPSLFSDGRPDALAVTLEPAGGMPQPTGPALLVGAFPPT
jgi:hypothetical protein